MPKQAIRPNYFKPLEDLENLEQKSVEDKIDLRDEEMLHAMANHDGWRVLKEFIEREINNLDSLNKAQMEKGANFEDIGRNAVISQLCKDELKRIINKVEDARQTIESQPA